MQETKKAVIIEDNADVDFIKSGNIVEIRYLEYRNTENHVKRIDKDHMLNNITGEVKDIQHHEKRIDDLTSVRRSMANLRRIINANCEEPKKCKWVTLTYKENMQDTKRLYLDFKHFAQEIRRQYGPCEYIAVAEPQVSWHTTTGLRCSRLSFQPKSTRLHFMGRWTPTMSLILTFQS